MKAQLKNLLEKERFNPGIIGFFINPYYFIRRGLYKGIKQQAVHLDGKLMDFGCGSTPYKTLFNVKEYIGVDIRESGNHKEHKNVDVFYDGKVIPFEDEVFDSVFTSEVFEHVFNLDEIVTEINRVLKINGKILITVPFVWDEHEVPYDFGRYTSYGITHVLEKHGFEVINLYKTTSFVKTIFQLWNSYLFQHVFRYAIIKAILVPIVFPINNLICIILDTLLPTNKDLYHNNVVLARKVKRPQ